MHTADIIVAAILLAAVIAALIFIGRKRKCGSSCAGCPMEGECTKKKELP